MIGGDGPRNIPSPAQGLLAGFPPHCIAGGLDEKGGRHNRAPRKGQGSQLARVRVLGDVELLGQEFAVERRSLRLPRIWGRGRGKQAGCEGRVVKGAEAEKSALERGSAEEEAGRMRREFAESSLGFGLSFSRGRGSWRHRFLGGRTRDEDGECMLHLIVC